MSLKAGRAGINLLQVDPVTGSIKGNTIGYGNGVKTNSELTDMVSIKNGDYVVNVGTDEGTYLIKQLNVVDFSIRLKSVTIAGGGKMVTLPDGFKPRTINNAILFNTSDGKFYRAYILEDGGVYCDDALTNATVRIHFVYIV